MSRRKRRTSATTGYSSENFSFGRLNPYEGDYIIDAIAPTIITSVVVVKHHDSVVYEVKYKDRCKILYEKFPPSELNLPHGLKHKEEKVRKEMEEIRGLISKLKL